MSSDPRVVRDVDLVVDDAPLAFARDHAAGIAAGWQRRHAANPRLWNGSAYLFHDVNVDEAAGILSARASRTDYATFLHWRDFDPLTLPYTHMFPVPAIVTADARLLVGRMSGHTANPGRLYPPAGSFDHSDETADGRLDPLANMLREVGEEIGVALSAPAGADRFLVFGSGPRRLALVRVFKVPATSAELAAPVAEHLANHHEQELDEVLFVPLGDSVDSRLAVPYVNPLLAYLGRNG